MRINQTALCLLACVLAWAATAQADVYWNGLYHNNTNLNPLTEAVPVELSPGATNHFLEVNYGTTNVTFYFLTDHPAGSDEVQTRVRLYTTREYFADGYWQTNFVLDGGNPFHGTPASGAVTLELWRAQWTPPRGFAGTIYYAPQIITKVGDVWNDSQYLVRSIGDNTNSPDWGVNSFFWVTNAQAIGTDPANVDYSFNWTNKLPLNLDYLYYNNTNSGLPQVEQVPGLGSTTFLQYSYDPNTPSYVYFIAPSFSVESARTRFYFVNGGGEAYRSAAFYTNVVITEEGFHDSPPGGTSVTLDVWRTAFYAPAGWPTNSSYGVYYGIEVRTAGNDPVMWMVNDFDGATNTATAFTNNWATNPQLFYSAGPENRDWGFFPTGKMNRAYSLNRNWAYHNHTNLNAQTEVIPDFGAVNFVEVDYANTQTTFYVITDKPLNLVPDEDVTLELKIWSPPTGDIYTQMTWVANLDLLTNSPFHGLPTNENKIVDLWKAVYNHPLSAGQPDTNEFNVYYVPLMKTLFGSDKYQTDYTWVIRRHDTANYTNDYPVNPQYFGPEFFNNDYYYTHKWQAGTHDGIPVEWWQRYFTNYLNQAATNDTDGDGCNNLCEYTGDTHPTNGLSFFGLIQTIVSGSSIKQIGAGPSTTNTRIYDVYFSTNLLKHTWTPANLNVPGGLGGGELLLNVTSDAAFKFYRTAVKIP